MSVNFGSHDTEKIMKIVELLTILAVTNNLILFLLESFYHPKLPTVQADGFIVVALVYSVVLVVLALWIAGFLLILIGPFLALFAIHNLKKAYNPQTARRVVVVIAGAIANYALIAYGEVSFSA